VTRYFISTLAIGVIFVGCGKKEKDVVAVPARAQDNAIREPKAPGEESTPKTGPLTGHLLLVAQSQFKANEKGLFTIPDKAVLALLKPARGKWAKEIIEDTESNVFHKALPYGREGILTIGGNEAILKLWQRKEGRHPPLASQFWRQEQPAEGLRDSRFRSGRSGRSRHRDP
jgi:hypothetical protein